MSYFIRWFHKQVNKRNGLLLVLPSVCFISSLFFISTHNFDFAVVIVTLLACSGLITSFLSGRYAEGVWLFIGAFLGLGLAELITLFPRTSASIMAIVGISILINPRFREWRAKQIALKGLTR